MSKEHEEGVLGYLDGATSTGDIPSEALRHSFTAHPLPREVLTVLLGSRQKTPPP